MPASDFTKVNVRRSTLARLRAEAASIIAAVEKGIRDDCGIDPEPINPKATGLSDDALINLLLDERKAHHRRAREQRQRKRKQKRPEVLGDGLGDGQNPPIAE